MDRPTTVSCTNCKKPVILLTEQAIPSICLLCQQKARQKTQKNKADPKHVHNTQKSSVNEPKDNVQKITIPILETKEQIDAWVSERKMKYRSKILYPSTELEEGEIKKANTLTFEQYSENMQKSQNRKNNTDSIKRQKVSLYENVDESADIQQHKNIHSRWNDIPSAHNILLSMIQYITSKHIDNKAI